MDNNVHVLSPFSEAMLFELTKYHRERLFDFDERMRRKDRASKLADTLGVPSVARAIQAMSTGRLRQDAPLEHEWRVDGDPQRIRIPFDALQLRDLSKATATAGGYLVGTETPEAVDILRPWSVMARAGIMIETGLVGDQAIPKTTGKAMPYWLSTESSQLTPSTPTVGQSAMTPKTAGAFVQFSRQLAKQANAEVWIRRDLLRTVGTAVDQAVLAGSGAAGQPTGILNTAGIGTETGTSLGYPGVCSMKRKVADANAPDDAISFLGTPAVRELLEQRERTSNGGQMVWDNNQVASRPAAVSTDVPAATLICGAWPALYLGIWGDGFVVEINPFDPAGFKSGTIQARILVSCDVAALHAAAFCKAEAIT